MKLLTYIGCVLLLCGCGILLVALEWVCPGGLEQEHGE